MTQLEYEAFIAAPIAVKIVGFDLGTMTSTAQEFSFFGELAHAGKIAQGRFIARRR